MGFGLRNLCRLRKLRKLRSVRQLPKLSRVLLCRVGGGRLFPTQAGLALFICPVAVEVATKILVAIAPSGWSLSLSRLPPNEAQLIYLANLLLLVCRQKRAIQAHRRFNTLLRDISDNRVKSPGRRPVDCFWHLTRPRLFYTVRRYIC